MNAFSFYQKIVYYCSRIWSKIEKFEIQAYMKFWWLTVIKFKISPLKYCFSLFFFIFWTPLIFTKKSCTIAHEFDRKSKNFEIRAFMKFWWLTVTKFKISPLKYCFSLFYFKFSTPLIFTKKSCTIVLEFDRKSKNFEIRAFMKF